MSLKNMTLKEGGTNAVSGGTDIVFADEGTTIQNGIRLIVPATADYRLRESVVAKVRAATVQPDGSYSKIKRSLSFVIPFNLASGVTSFQTMRLEMEIHPEAEATVRSRLLVLAAQMLFDTDTSSFWTTGSLS